VTTFTVAAVGGLGEVTPGTDLAAAVLEHVTLEDGDVLVVTSKVVSKAEGRVVTASKAEALASETDRVVARRGDTAIVRTRHGLVMAGAGIDASNTEPGTLVLLPEDPDRSARAIRARVRELAGLDVAVVVSDTSGRAWRTGQTDVAIGAAGLRVLDDHAGRVDGYGNLLAVTAPALADEIAGAGDLAKGKLSMTPVAVVRGLAELVLPAGQDGAGAAVLVRDEGSDMFGYGAREAVSHALLGGDLRGFGDPVAAEVLVAALAVVAGEDGDAVVSPDTGEVVVDLRPSDVRERGRLEARLEVAAHAHGWRPTGQDGDRRVSFRAWLP
jgi:coenzyme F420-0:L-glutamate ligase / coenzyme F420-1:gamma-L-glutamate ligase